MKTTKNKNIFYISSVITGTLGTLLCSYQLATAKDLILTLKPNTLQLKTLKTKTVKGQNGQNSQKQLVLSPFNKQRLEKELGEKIISINPISETLLAITTDDVPISKISKKSTEKTTSKNKLIEDISNNGRLKPLNTTNDQYFNRQWYLQPISWRYDTNLGTYGANFTNSWNEATGQNQVVAVLDTGVIDHEDLGTLSPVAGQYISSGYDFISDCREANTCNASTTTNTARSPQAGARDLGDVLTTSDVTNTYFEGCTPKTENSWHGTHIAGTIASKTNNAVGVAGSSYNAKILPIRVSGRCGARDSDVINGMLWAAGLHPTITNPNPAKIINVSLGTVTTDNAGNPNTKCTTAYLNAFQQLSAQNVTVVTAAGNYDPFSASSDQRLGYAENVTPGNCNRFDYSRTPFTARANNLINVTASDIHGEKAYYANYNAFKNSETVDIAVPGGDDTTDPGIFSTVGSANNSNAFSSSYKYLQGTSESAPQAAAAIALLRQVDNTINTDTIRLILKGTAMPLPNASGNNTKYDCLNNRCGSGLLNAALATQVLKAKWTPTFDGVVGKGALIFTNTVAGTQTMDFTNITGLVGKINSIRFVSSNLQTTPNYSVTENCTTPQTAVNNLATCRATINYQPSNGISATNTIISDNLQIVTSYGSYNILVSAIPTIRKATPNPTPTPNPTTSSTKSGGGCTLINDENTNNNSDNGLLFAMLGLFGIFGLKRMKRFK